MTAKTCTEAYLAGKEFSQLHSRIQGAYKLTEILGRYTNYELEVRRIGRAVHDPSTRWDLVHCTFQDMDIWLRHILLWYAYDLSAKIIPSFRALTGDGMSKAEIDRLLPQVITRCETLLKVLENARLNVEGSIIQEYERMQHGQSVVGDAQKNVRETLKDIIRLTPTKIQVQINPPIQEVN